MSLDFCKKYLKSKGYNFKKIPPIYEYHLMVHFDKEPTPKFNKDVEIIDFGTQCNGNEWLLYTIVHSTSEKNVKNWLKTIGKHTLLKEDIIESLVRIKTKYSLLATDFKNEPIPQNTKEVEIVDFQTEEEDGWILDVVVYANSEKDIKNWLKSMGKHKIRKEDIEKIND